MKNLAEYRKIRGLTQKELAQKVGVDTPAVSKWEQGIRHPGYDKMILLREVLNCTIDELIGD